MVFTKSSKNTKITSAKYIFSSRKKYICHNELGGGIHVDASSINVFQQSGCYYQAFADINIGKNVWMAKNVGIITANHLLSNPEKHDNGKPVEIGDSCWIGMNAVLLPGVKLGNNTVVGAGSIVTKSFEGHCVIAGNPARVIKYIN